MARRRFLVERIRDNAAEVRGEDARHLARVLRAEAGQQYEVSDGAGVYLAEIAAVEKERVIFRVIEALDTPQAPVRLTLCPALIKFDRFEWLVEKATELGVAGIVPVDAARSETGLSEAARKRAARWRRIAHESSHAAWVRRKLLDQCRWAWPSSWAWASAIFSTRSLAHGRFWPPSRRTRIAAVRIACCC
jgi:16S rRNA (uracil1498-N3)-methyltransferase